MPIAAVRRSAAASAALAALAPSGRTPRPAVAADEVARRGPLAGIRYGRELAAAARVYRLDPTLVAAVAAQESGGPGEVSGRAGAGRENPYGKGLMQLNPAFYPVARTDAAFDPAVSARAGARILRENLDRAHGNVREAIREYNCGPYDAGCTGEVSRWNDGPLGYVDSVLRHQRDIVRAERH